MNKSFDNSENSQQSFIENDVTPIIDVLVNNTISIAIQNEKDHRERLNTAKSIINEFTLYSNLCNMIKDDINIEIDDKFENNGHNWKIESEPKRIKEDSWSSNMVPIKYISKQIKINTTQQENNIKKNKSTSKLVRKKSTPKILKQNIKENIDETASKPFPLFKDDESSNKKIDKIKNSKKKNKKKITDSGKTLKSIDTNNESNDNINKNSTKNLKSKRHQKIDLQFNSKKPFTFDHNGNVLNVVPIKPDKIPDNTFECCIDLNENDEKLEIIEDELEKNNKKPKKKRKKKSNTNFNSVELKTEDEYIIPTVVVQPPIESILKPTNGVILKTKTGNVYKGKEINKNTINNLSKTKYNELLKSAKFDNISNDIDNEIDKNNELSKNSSKNDLKNNGFNINKKSTNTVLTENSSRLNLSRNKVIVNNYSFKKKINDPTSIALSPNRLVSWQNKSKILSMENESKKYPKQFKRTSIKSEIKLTKNANKYLNDI